MAVDGDGKINFVS